MELNLKSRLCISIQASLWRIGPSDVQILNVNCQPVYFAIKAANISRASGVWLLRFPQRRSRMNDRGFFDFIGDSLDGDSRLSDIAKCSDGLVVSPKLLPLSVRKP